MTSAPGITPRHKREFESMEGEWTLLERPVHPGVDVDPCNPADRVHSTELPVFP
jgi:hypothetical protein